MRAKNSVYILLIGLVLLFAGCAGPKPTIMPESAMDIPQNAHDQGMKFLADSKYDEAINSFRHVVGLDPRFEAAYIGLCLAYTGKGDYKMARENVEEALDMKKDPAAYVAYGRMYTDQGKFEKAIDRFNDAVEIDPKYAEAFYYKGQMYEKRGKYSEARIAYKNALTVNRNYLKANAALESLDKSKKSQTGTTEQ
ncbi:MAG: tetratricopeptide repeat protein [bacterium]